MLLTYQPPPASEWTSYFSSLRFRRLSFIPSFLLNRKNTCVFSKEEEQESEHMFFFKRKTEQNALCSDETARWFPCYLNYNIIMYKTSISLILLITTQKRNTIYCVPFYILSPYMVFSCFFSFFKKRRREKKPQTPSIPF